MKAQALPAVNSGFPPDILRTPKYIEGISVFL